MKQLMPRFIRIATLVLLFCLTGCKNTGTPTSAYDSASGVQPKDATAYVCVPASDDLRAFLIKLSLNREARISEQTRGALLIWAALNPTGSGTLIDVDEDYSLVVTNHHVVIHGRPFISFDEGQTMIRGTILYADIENDLAVIEIPKRPSGFRLASSYAGSQKVTAFGYPGMGLKGTFQSTDGSISNTCIHKNDVVGGSHDRCLLQHTAPIDPGSSGGPLVTQDGLVGVNLGFSIGRQDVRFAIPVEAVRTSILAAEKKRKLSTDKEVVRKELLQACSRLGNNISSLYLKADELLSVFSEQLIIQKGQEALETSSISNTEKFLQNPALSMFAAIAVRMHAIFEENKGMSGQGCILLDPIDVFSKDGVQATILLNSGLRLNTTWLFKGNGGGNGGWSIINYEHSSPAEPSFLLPP